MTGSWDRARAIADAVLYEGYLLYPYRGTSDKNRSRWQWGVLGPPGAAEAGLGEEPALAAQLLLDGAGEITLTVRFLHLQHRQAQRDRGDSGFESVHELSGPTGSWLSWDEAVEWETSLGPLALHDLAQAQTLPLTAAAATEFEPVDGGRLVRDRRTVRGELTASAEPDGELVRVSVRVANVGAAAADRSDAIARSLIGTHLIAEAAGAEFVSLLEPPPHAAGAVSRCTQHRCFPVLAGLPGQADLMLISPIILYDHPEIAEQSAGPLYDATEIDELLTLRVMTMTDDEKSAARATDARAAQIIDRCDAMPPEALAGMHGVLRDPHRVTSLIPEVPDGVSWWDPLAENAVRPDTDAMVVNGVRVARGSRVRLRPSRRADAQDMFLAGRTARVTSVHEDVDGNRHLGVVVDDEPVADLHQDHRRCLYFAPDEIEPCQAPRTEERSSTWKS